MTIATMNFPEYPSGFSKLNRVLYVGIADDIKGLEELAQKHSYVVGIDKFICEDPTHFHNKHNDFLKKRNEMLQQYPNLHIERMDAKELNFPDESFDEIIFKRSLGLVGGNAKVKNEKDISRALNEAYRTLSQEGLLWVIYAGTDIIDLTLDKMNLLLKSSGFETVEYAKDNRVCRKIEK